MIKTVEWTNEGVRMIDQRLLPGEEKYLMLRSYEEVAEAMPFLRGRFAAHQAFANVGVEEILRDRKAQFLGAACLESSVFLNRGDKLEMRVLPAEAQFAPAFAAVVADYDGDGHEDMAGTLVVHAKTK